MDLNDCPSTVIHFPGSFHQEIVRHCKRKLEGRFVDGESPEKKAFGLIVGRKKENVITVYRCYPLLKNARFESPHCDYMDRILAEHAIPSETELSKRGWVADSGELRSIIGECRKEGNILVGSYHMHRVGWKDDPVRDTPTQLDTILAAGSRIIMFVLSMVDPERPIMRAFYEGMVDREIPILLLEEIPPSREFS